MIWTTQTGRFATIFYTEGTARVQVFPSRNTARRTAARALTCGVTATGLALGAALGLAACTPAPQPTSTPASGGGQRGRAGAGGSSGGPDDYAGAPDEGSWNQADAAFVTGMIEHHLQALEIAALAPDRAGSDAVRSFAERVTAARGPAGRALAAGRGARGRAGAGAHERTC